MESGGTALVTGAASGIGQSVARLLAGRGYRPALVDVQDAEDVARTLGGAYYRLDIAQADQVAATLAKVGGDLGPIDVLVNCAGWDRAKPFTETDQGFWERVIDINLLGPIAITHAALSLMPDGSAIVNVASDAGRVGSSGEVVYSAAKGGVIAFTKALAREVARRRIRVKCRGPRPDRHTISGRVR